VTLKLTGKPCGQKAP